MFPVHTHTHIADSSSGGRWAARAFFSTCTYICLTSGEALNPLGLRPGEALDPLLWAKDLRPGEALDPLSYTKVRLGEAPMNHTDKSLYICVLASIDGGINHNFIIIMNE